jgi:DNA-directed RNA polymerase specialized sigma24 family protein
MTTDADLLRDYSERGSERAFAALVDRHLQLVYATALRELSGSAHRGDDVAQSVFIDLARKGPRLVGRTSVVGWLYTSTHFAGAKLKRSKQRRAAREREAHMLECGLWTRTCLICHRFGTICQKPSVPYRVWRRTLLVES